MYENYIKRKLDVAFALVLILIAAPIVIACALLIKYESEGPILFQQTRLGKYNRVFKVIKFRTMRIQTLDAGQELTDRQRITKVGAFLRKTSIDELPQLFNILMGEMSFIGPRPLLPQYLTLYDQNQQRRHEVTSGISGWAQVNGRNAISWDEKFKLDVYYVDHISFILDLKIFFLTIYQVLRRKDVDHSRVDTMPFFKGEPE